VRNEIKPAAASAPANKLLGLELLRFLAAFAILVYHYRQFAFVGDEEADLFLDQLPFHCLLGPLYESGPYAVRIF